MKKIIFLALIALMTTVTYSQGQKSSLEGTWKLAQIKIHEFGLSYSGYNLFGIRYKCGNDKTLLRLTIQNAGGTHYKHEDSNYITKSNDKGIGLNIGFQKSRSVADNVYFYYGADLFMSYEKRINSRKNSYKSTDKIFSPGLGCVLGFAYYFSDNVNISAEVLPSVWYSSAKNITKSELNELSNTTRTVGYGLNREGISYANLTLSFRINHK